jgi:hypothetical protein
MDYAAGIAHNQRLPAMTSVFKPLVKALITKTLRRKIWGYWYLTSQPGAFVDSNPKKPRKPWVDPACRENIMYKIHVLPVFVSADQC